MSDTALVWLRHDLRLADNPALRAAVDRHEQIVPVFVWSPDEEGEWAPGAASRVWLHESLAALADDLVRRGSRLVLRSGEALAELLACARYCGAGAVYWNRRYEPAVVHRDMELKRSLREHGIAAESFNGALLHEPWEVQNRSGKPFRVYTPFWRHCRSLGEPERSLPAVRKLPPPARWPAGLALDDLGLRPTVHWDEGVRAAWEPGERGAARALRAFCDGAIARYGEDRDRPGVGATSLLSPHLHFGETSPRLVWQAVRKGAGHGKHAEAYLREVIWREFAHHVLFHFPHTPTQPLQEKFARFPWRRDRGSLRAWQRGRTGYPLVDAGMRELWTTGWMHNRIRMVVASFLVKHLLLPWQEGARWFWDTLVDADLANNTLGWQWTAGCGADAAPFFRIFNPVAQGERFDPAGRYVRAWVPELADLPRKWIHRPWAAPAQVLEEAGVILGRTYPRPIVDHAAARERALYAFERV